MKRIAATAALVAVSVLGAELAARMLLWQPRPDADVGTIRYGYSLATAGDYFPHQDGVYITTAVHRVRPFHVATNSDGLRNREEVRTDGLRILALGDSQTFGLFSNSQDVWTEWLQYGLRRDGNAVQVLNNGLPGTSIDDQARYFSEKGRGLAPDVVVLCAHTNDLADLGKGQSVREEGMEMARSVKLADVRWFLGHHSALYDAAKQVKEWLMERDIRRRNREQVATAQNAQTLPAIHDPGLVSGDSDALRAAYATHFDRFAAQVADSGARLVLAYLPGPKGGPLNGTVGDFLKGLARARGVAFVDLTAALEARPVDEMWLLREGDPDYPGDAHLSRSGHMAVAQALRQALMERGWLTPRKTAGGRP